MIYRQNNCYSSLDGLVRDILWCYINGELREDLRGILLDMELVDCNGDILINLDSVSFCIILY